MHRGIISGSILQTDEGKQGPLATLEPGSSIQVGSLNDVSEIFGDEEAPTPLGHGISFLDAGTAVGDEEDGDSKVEDVKNKNPFGAGGIVGGIGGLLGGGKGEPSNEFIGKIVGAVKMFRG